MHNLTTKSCWLNLCEIVFLKMHFIIGKFLAEVGILFVETDPETGKTQPVTDYRYQERVFFQKSRTFGLGQTFWAEMFWGFWGIFGRTINTHFGNVSSMSMFSIIQPLFLQKTKPLCPNPKYLFGIGIWIGAAKNLRFSLRVSVVRATGHTYPCSGNAVLLMKRELIFSEEAKKELLLLLLLLKVS